MSEKDERVRKSEGEKRNGFSAFPSPKREREKRRGGGGEGQNSESEEDGRKRRAGES